MKRLDALLTRRTKLERELAMVRLQIATTLQEHRRAKTNGQLSTRAQQAIFEAVKIYGSEIKWKSMGLPSDHPDAVAAVLHCGLYAFRRAPNVGDLTIADIEGWLNSKGASFYSNAASNVSDEVQ